MRIDLNGHSTYVGTGGKELDANLPTVVFLHGSGMDHRAWALQTRWFAFHGYSVVAPDFPAHSLSAGVPLASIEESAKWLVQLLDGLEVEQVHLVGHSQGFLTALEFAKAQPERVLSLVGIGTAAAIPVNPALIETAKKSAFDAAQMMLQWGFGSKIHLGFSPTPGMQPVGQGLQIMGLNPLAVDLQSCADYQDGEEAIQTIMESEHLIPTAMILGEKDKMTPIKSGLAAGQALNAQIEVLNDMGHMLPIESPRKVLDGIRNFIQAHS